MCNFQKGQTGEKNMQDQLIGALIGLARATDGNEHLISEASTAVILEGLAADSNMDPGALMRLLERIEQVKREMVPNCFTCACPCGRNNAYDMDTLWNGQEDIRDLKILLLLGIRCMAAYAHRAAALGHGDDGVNRFFYKALNAIGMDHWSREGLLPIVLEVGEVYLRCRALPDRANAEG